MTDIKYLLQNDKTQRYNSFIRINAFRNVVFRNLFLSIVVNSDF